MTTRAASASQNLIWGAVLLSAAGWGTGGVVTRLALDDGATPYEIAMARGVLAALLVFVYLAVRRHLHRPTAVVWRVGLVAGFANMAVPFVLATISLQYASAGFVALPAALIPLVTAALAHVFLPDDRLSVAKVIGLVTAMVGVAVLLLSGDSGLAEGGRPLVAGGLGLISVVTIAAGSIYAKHHAGRYGTLDVSGIQFASGAVWVALAALVAGDGLGAGPVESWPELIYLASITTFLPFTLFYWLIRHVTATYASVIGYIVPLIAVIVGVIALDEQVQPGILIGGLLIMAGVIVTDRLERRVTTRPPVPPIGEGESWDDKAG
jgi:drug/metabolite transporter (DMT)-like permease